MGLKEGSIIPINLFCGCSERRITILHGKQVIRCPECGKKTVVVIEINSNDEVGHMKVRESWG